MSGKNFKWTDQQSRAIKEHDRNVLVSASAGTGKTAVLSGRCVDIVEDRKSCPDIWSILVLTFTDMAAEEMRSRIAKHLNEAIESNSDSSLRHHLRRQLILLGAADISTIHSFCKRLITGHFYQLNLDPAFRVIDADEAKLLKAEALEKTIDWAWNEPSLVAALRQLLARRNLGLANGILSEIIDISGFLDTVVSRDDWLSRASVLAETADPYDTDLAQFQKQIIETTLAKAIDKIHHAEKIHKNVPGSETNPKFENTYIKPVELLLTVLKKDDWRKFTDEIRNFKKPRVDTPKGMEEGMADLIHDTIKNALDSIDDILDLAVMNPDYLSKLTGAVGSQVKVLIELVRQFDKFYRQSKNAINCLDFADLEHYALRLLTGEESRPSQTALRLREKYKYIFVDEFQDINSVQQKILDLIGSQENIFAVGDPKQIIYQWRGANPEIFLKNLKSASTKPSGSKSGLRVDLTKNFRSVKGVLDFVNLVFGRIMTESFANMNYDKSAYLEPADQTKDAAENFPAVELHILDKPDNVYDSDADDDQSPNNSQKLSGSRQSQAIVIADRIKQLIGLETGKPELLITDKKTKTQRPVEYRDIVVLMRSLAGRNDFIEALRLSGIPVSCVATAGYFQATEILDMLSLLKILDNPRRDIELAAVLRSPFFNFTDTDLAKIRLWGKKSAVKSGFYDCIINYCSSPDDSVLAKKICDAVSTLENWRTIARRGRIAELIWLIYRQTGFLSFVGVLPQPDARRANLLKLHDRAIQFEGFVSSSGVPSLIRFIDFIEKLLDAGQDWSPAEPESATGNAVRVLSVHKSKGLEFPVVFLADLDGRFKKKPVGRDCLFDENYTLGLKLIDQQSNSRLDSLAFQVIEEKYRRKTMAEEMRILYVAMTRAIDRLILVGSKEKTDCLQILKSASFFDDGPLPDWRLDSCSSHLDWILSALGLNPILHEAFKTGHQSPADNKNLYSVKIYNFQEIEKLSTMIQGLKQLKIINQKSEIINKKDFTSIKQSLAWPYPFPDAPLLPAKRSVSQYTHRNDEFTVLDYSHAFDRLPKSVFAAKQSVASSVEPTDGRLIGTATHLVLSLLDFDKPVSAESINNLIEKLVAYGSVPATVAPLIDVNSIIKFFESDLGQMTLDKKNKISREWPFTFALPASEWNKDVLTTQNSTRSLWRSPVSTGLKTKDSIIIQGIIDLLIETPQGLIIIDFKTDSISMSNDERRMTNDDIYQRAELYRPQLDLYARAASAILNQKIISKWLYFLRPCLPFKC